MSFQSSWLVSKSLFTACIYKDQSQQQTIFQRIVSSKEFQSSVFTGMARL